MLVLKRKVSYQKNVSFVAVIPMEMAKLLNLSNKDTLEYKINWNGDIVIKKNQNI